MKLLITLITSLTIFIGCDSYQNGLINLSPVANIAPGGTAISGVPYQGKVIEELTNDNTFDQNMQMFLDMYLVPLDNGTQDTRVDYDKIYEENNTAELKELKDNMATQIAKADLEAMSRDEKVAFLINAYNYLAIQTIDNNYNDGALESIGDIGGAGTFTAFSSPDYAFLVAGEMRTLDNIEKRDLKGILTFSESPLKLDARFHFAVICAAKGCPILVKEAYTADKINEQLNASTVAGLELKRNLDTSGDGVLLTQLFNWYGADFDAHVTSADQEPAGSAKAFINIFMPEADLSGPIGFVEYDWSLNKPDKSSYQGQILEETTNSNTLSQNMQLFLDQFLVPVNNGTQDTLVDYDKIFTKNGTKALRELKDNMATQIAKADLEAMTRDEKIAFLINTYNYLAIQVVDNSYVIDGVKLASITDIGGVGSFTAFGSPDYAFEVAGEMRTLDDIEKRDLKGILTFSQSPLKIDARFHFAVICAAKGCPILVKEAYVADKINEQLNAATIAGLELKRNLDTSGNGVLLTQLFNWYGEDFNAHVTSADETPAGSAKGFVKIFMPNADLSGSINFVEYNWALNRAEGK